ncbi:MAG: HlyD family efflux transporter periplasmic adaptor subunit [Alphaproteobacteria bacterium]|nr:HlyD family efflux transporter periplasmic adaptor subunit [Alphaproteobacteria bacterium]
MLHLNRAARFAESVEDVYFMAVNETHKLVSYDEAVLWHETSRNSIDIRGISGLSSFDRSAPKIVWFNRLFSFLETAFSMPSKEEDDQFYMVTKEDCPDKILAEWGEFSVPFGLYIPFVLPGSKMTGGLFFTRSTAWTEKECKLLQEAVSTYAYALSFQMSVTREPFILKVIKYIKRKRFLFVGFLVLLSFWPVRVSVIAPMEVVPQSPWIMTAPQDGVIQTIHVQPNQRVKKGDRLVSLDDTKLRNEVVLAEQALGVVQQQLRQAQQRAFSERKNNKNEGYRGDAALLSLDVQQKQNELCYMQELLAKTQIFSEISGIAVFNDATELEGSPIRTGERILWVADEGDVQIEVQVSVEDMIELKTGTRADSFLYSNPLHPVRGKISNISYDATETKTRGQLAYNIKVSLTDAHKDTLPRIGFKGTAKLYGNHVTLFYHVFRRPISYVWRYLF